MGKEDQANQLNLTVVALVALVAIVGLVALVMNAATVTKLATGSKLVTAQPTNVAGKATDTAIDPANPYLNPEPQALNP